MQTIGGGYYDPWTQSSSSSEATTWNPTPSKYSAYEGTFTQGITNTTQKKASSYSGPTGSGTGKSRLGAGGEVSTDAFLHWDPSTFKQVEQADAWVPITQPQFQQQLTQQKYVDPSLPHVRYRTGSIAPGVPTTRPSPQQQSPPLAPTSVLPSVLSPTTQAIAGPPSLPVAIPSLAVPQATPASPNKSTPTTTGPAPLVRRNSRSGSIGSGSVTPNRGPDIESELQQQSLYKTELCRSWNETGTCRYGSKCQFAHGAEELRPVQRHPKYKTEVCRSWAATGTCPYGTRCRFIHNKSDRPADWALLQAAAQYSPSSPTAPSPLALASAPTQSEIELFSGAFDAGLTLNEPEPVVVVVPPTPLAQVEPPVAPSAARRPSIVPVVPTSIDPTLLPPPQVVIPTSPAVLPPPSTPLPPPIAPTVTVAAQTVTSASQTGTSSPASSSPTPSNKKEKRLPIFQRLTAAFSSKGAVKSKEKDTDESKDKDKRKK